MDADDIVAAGHSRAVIDVLTRLERNEHKRWQMSPAPGVTSKAFGQGWRRPLASRHDWRIDFDGHKNQTLHLVP